MIVPRNADDFGLEDDMARIDSRHWVARPRPFVKMALAIAGAVAIGFVSTRSATWTIDTLRTHVISTITSAQTTAAAAMPERRAVEPECYRPTVIRSASGGDQPVVQGRVRF